MADDLYGTNQQESNNNVNTESIAQQQGPQIPQNQQDQQGTQAQQDPQNPQPQQNSQLQQNSQPKAAKNVQAYSPAPEFGAYGPVNNSGTASQPNVSQPSANQPNANTAPASYVGPQNPYAPSANTSNAFGNPYESNENINHTNGDYANQNAQQNLPPVFNSTNEVNDSKTSAVNKGEKFANLQANNNTPPVMIAILSAVISAIVCVVVMTFVVSQGLIAIPQGSSLESVGSKASGPGTAIVKGAQSPDWRGVARQVSGSVISIQTRLAKGMGKGSGVIIDSKGYAVTNNHVIADAKQIQVTLSNGQIYSATLVGADKTTDLAVLKIDNPPKNLKTAQFANSDLLAVGEAVMAIGNPLGYDDTATTGIVSALNRPVSVMDDQSRSEIVTNAVQIDAAINPGNSGGPTFNAAGQIIGINSSIAATSTQGGTAGSIGIGFAIPANLVKRVVSEIIKNGSVKHVALGIMIKSVAVESNGITRGGAQIVSVNQGTPAAKAGLKAGDTIVAFDDKPVANNYALLGYVRATAFNNKATLTVVRGGNTLKLTVTFDQEEAAVSGINRKEKTLKKDKKNSRNRGKKSNDDDDDDLQQRDDSDGDDGGIFDPFGFW
ncbi:S1C family serine protease [Gardnerella sp. DNF01141]|uniref:S1C family serine protease n=1 Tax=Gardnerella sp. DNF01141 TaxID=2749057 RepID=UPI003BACF5AC